MKVLFRQDVDNQDELPIVSSYIPTVQCRTECEQPGLVIGRYSVLPFYRELEKDLDYFGAYLINSYQEHSWIADFKYYDILYQFTPKTWEDHNFWSAPEGCYVLKGKTNSKKHQWNTHMFAASKREAAEVASRLANNELIGPQGILYREYVPLKTFSKGLNDLPYTDEWRFFFFREDLLSYGYYWCCEENADNRIIDRPGVDFAKKIAAIVSRYVDFFVIDVAQTEAGNWILIELNDGQMSGLSMNDPHELYSNLSQI